MRYALIDPRTRVVYMTIVAEPSTAMHARWTVVRIADDADVSSGDMFDGTNFDRAGPRARPFVGNRYALAGAHAMMRAIDRLPADQQAAALLKGKA